MKITFYLNTFGDYKPVEITIFNINELRSITETFNQLRIDFYMEYNPEIVKPITEEIQLIQLYP